jgi:hypothetical protein
MCGSRLAITARPSLPRPRAEQGLDDHRTRDPVTSPPLPVPDRIARGQPSPNGWPQLFSEIRHRRSIAMRWCGAYVSSNPSAACIHLHSERQPPDLAGAVAAVAMRRLVEGVGKLPFLRFIAPLCRDVRNDVIGLASGTHRRRTRRVPVDGARLRLRVDDGRLLRIGTEWIEKHCVSHGSSPS